MPKVLTTGSNVTCGHEGTVATSSTAKLKINGQPVLLQEGIVGKTVENCLTPTVSNPTSSPCASVSSVDKGNATKLTGGGNAVMLETLTGGTNGVVSGNAQTFLSATAGQSKLTTI
jgi:hypothetical protein